MSALSVGARLIKREFVKTLEHLYSLRARALLQQSLNEVVAVVIGKDLIE